MGSFRSVVSAEGQAGAWLLDELKRMLAVGLIDPFVWVDPDAEVDGSDLHDPKAVLHTSEGQTTDALTELLARRSEPGIVRLVRVVLPGTQGQELEGVRGRLELLQGEDLVPINLLVPTEDLEGEERGPVLSRSQLLPAWRNLVVSPEDATESTYVTVEVSDRLIPHAAAAVASAAGLWVAQDGQTPVDEFGHPGNTQTCTLLRCSTRSLVVAQRADIAVGRALRMAHPVARTVVRDEELVREASDDTARVWSTHAADAWLSEDGHPFRFRDPSPPAVPVAQYVGLRGTWRLFIDFIFRRLPKAVKSDLSDSLDSARERLGDKLSDTVFEDDAAYRFSFTARGAADEQDAGEEGSIDRLEQHLVSWVEMNGGMLGASTEPGVWKSLRAVSFGLLDAGPVPTRLELPEKRHIVGDPARVFGPAIGPHVLNERARDLLPPVDHLLRRGDLAGLGDVRALVVAMLESAGLSVADPEGRTAVTSDDKPWPRRLAALALIACLSLIVWLLWKRPLDEPDLWYATTGLGIGGVLSLVAMRRWRKPDTATSGSSTADVGEAETAQLSEEDIRALEAQLEVLDVLDTGLRQSFSGRVAEQLLEHVEAAVNRAAGMRQIIRTPAAQTQGTAGRAKGLLRRALSAAARPALAIAGVLAIVLLLVSLPLGGIVLGVIGVVLALCWFAVVIGWVLQYVRRKLADTLRLPEGESETSWASRAVYHVLTEVARLHRNYTVLVEWVGMLDGVARDPFGPAAESPERDVSMTLRRLHGHQIAHGDMDEITLDRIVSGLEEELLRPGWVGAAFETLRTGASTDYQRRFHIRSADKADPDTDVNPGFTDLRSPRSHLAKWLKDPANMFSVRVSLIGRGFEWMSAQAPSELLAGITNRRTTADEFLKELLLGRGREFLTTIFEHGYEPPEIRQQVWLPAPVLSTQNTTCLPSGVSPNVLLYQSATVEWIESVDVVNLRVLGADRATVEAEALQPSADLTDAPAPQLDQADIDRNRKREIRMLDGFPVGSLIKPNAEPSVPANGQFSFLLVVDGEPLRFPLDPPISFEVRKAGGPVEGLAMVRELLQELSDASGLSFRFTGLTDEFPGYGGEGAERPLWIGWVYPDDGLVGSEPASGGGGSILGRGGVRSFEPYGGEPFLSPGVATVRADLDYTQAFGEDGVRAVLLHELGHAMNLGHVDDPNEIMYPTYAHGARSTLGQGDRRGLWLLGSGR